MGGRGWDEEWRGVQSATTTREELRRRVNSGAELIRTGFDILDFVYTVVRSVGELIRCVGHDV